MEKQLPPPKKKEKGRGKKIGITVPVIPRRSTSNYKLLWGFSSLHV
jgi:hypothetical protein